MKKTHFFAFVGGMFVLWMAACESTDLRAVSGIEPSSAVIESSSSAIVEASSSSIVSELSQSSSSVMAVASSSSVMTVASSSSVIVNEVRQSSSSTTRNDPQSSSSSEETSAEILGTCAPESDSIVMTAWATWVFTQTSPEDLTEADGFKFKWIIEGSYQGTASGKGLRIAEGQYPKAGTYEAKLTINGGDTITCSPLTVTVAPITDCECTTDAEMVDVSSGYVLATWRISGCKSILGISKYEWSSDVNPTWVDAAHTFTMEGESVTPTVNVSNDNGSLLEVTCPTVTAISSN